MPRERPGFLQLSKYAHRSRWIIELLYCSPHTPSGLFACRDNFFNDTYAKSLYKQHVRAVLTRVNTVTGVEYRKDPAIFGCVPLWNVFLS